MIGNPPYGAKLSAADKDALRKVFTTTQTIKGVQKGSLDTFTMFIEQGFNMLCKNGCFAMIVPIALTSSDSLSGIHRILLSQCDEVRVSSYAVRPQPVFKNAVVDVSILLFTKTENKCNTFKSTRLHRKGKGFSLDTLINNLQFTEVKEFITFGRIPKIGTEIERCILTKLIQHKRISDYIAKGGDKIYYRFAGGRYFKVVTNYTCHSSAERAIEIECGYANVVGALLSSSLSFWYYQIYSDNHNWKDSEVKSLAVPKLTKSDIAKIENLYAEYLADIERNANVRQSSGASSYNVDTFKEYKIVKSKAIIDRIDDLICPLYGLTQEETDFIKNYELEFRMSGDD